MGTLFKPSRATLANNQVAKIFAVGVLSLFLAACGGGKSGSSNTVPDVANPDSVAVEDPAQTATTTVELPKPATRAEAARFLAQATFGPTEAEISRVMEIGYTAWMKEQMALPMASRSHLSYWNERNAAVMAVNSAKRASSVDVTNSFWRQALVEPDQLRQRVAFALSQIFVVSMADGCGDDKPQGVAGYLDMLGAKAFGTYRALLESVALHPMMGCYLSHLKNQKEDVVTGRVPDENFAREIMQLFSIGLYQLNMDGTLKLDAVGNPIETYGANDVAGLAKVFTGFSWDCPGWPSDRCFYSGMRDGDLARSPTQYTAPMRPYAKFHSTSEKRFLGQVIPAQTTAKPEDSLQVALDTIAAHPNVAPFIGRQMIQRLVTSNPSPAYVLRVASAFKRSGLNLGVLVSAVLSDPEARANPSLSMTEGKVREPILKLSALLRAFNARSATGDYLIGATHNPANSLGQSPLRSQTVFNFYRPGYVPPSSNTANQKMVAPELQLANETASAGYINFVRDAIWAGVGSRGYFGEAVKPDVQFEFNVDANSRWLGLAIENPSELVAGVSDLLTYGTLSSDLKSEIVTAISSVDYRTSKPPTPDEIYNTKLRRVWSAVLLVSASPEFQVQR